MTPLLVILLLVGFVALVTAGVASVELVRRRRVVSRVSGADGPGMGVSVLRPESDTHTRGAEFLERLQESQKENEALTNKLTQAGYDSPTAAAIYFLLRLSSMVMFPLVTLMFIPRANFRLYVLGLLVAVIIGYILPVALLDRTIRLRQERIRRAVPDALDLLVVCVEAGVSLDAAILRVAREVRLVHTDLAHELHVVNRLTNAGVPREAALRGLWQRTGVEDIRALVSSLIQSEKWGTSVATVLRVAAETLRRKRKQYAEKKAKQAPLKMTFPLLFFILPALFTVIMGPAVATIIKEFGKV
jgi:tight adherence protein C